MNRRSFVKWAGLSIPSALWGTPIASGFEDNQEPPGTELEADVVVIGGGLGGCAAALAALRHGHRVILTEETDWIGGQLTAQAVPPDEHRSIETHGATRTYREFRQGIRDYYRRHYPLTDAARAKEALDPGNGSVSRLCHEPRVALAVLYERMAPYLGAGRLAILLDHAPVEAETEADRVRSVTVRDGRTGVRRTLSAPFVLDATEQGDLLPLAGVDYVTGFESRHDTDEPHAPDAAQPENLQAFTWCFPMEYVAGGDFTIAKPLDYDFWASYVPPLTPPWPGRLFSWTYTNPITLQPRTLAFDPATEAPGWWLYRRIADKANFTPDAYPGSVTLVNWPQNDYLPGSLVDRPADEVERHLEGGRRLSLALFYWMQTAAPRPDGGVGWPGLRLRPELTDTPDGLAKAPYVREGRRIRAVFTVAEQHVGLEARQAITKQDQKDVEAAPFDDSVGVGSYRIDLHPSTGGDNYIDLASLPFRIPLGSLLPIRMRNLLPACKNLGTTHITNGCYRLHPVEWNIGESAGALAAFCLETKSQPHEVRAVESKLRAFQKSLQADGVELSWPRA